MGLGLAHTAFGRHEELTLEDRVFAYLDQLRESAAINMLGAGKYVEETFDLEKSHARDLLTAWMKGFGKEE